MPVVCHHHTNRGAPRISGTRLTVRNVVTTRWGSTSPDELQEDFGVSPEDEREAVDYCKSLRCLTDTRRVAFCSGCILDMVEPRIQAGGPLARSILREGAVALEDLVTQQEYMRTETLTWLLTD